MPKRTANWRFWRWARGFFAASLPAVLLVVSGLGNAVRADDLVRSNSPPPSATEAWLEYQETAYSVFNWSVSITPQSAPFKKEPAAVSGKVVRGILNFGGNPGNSIPFLWQRDARKLFLDLNRNQDLTDDPAGVFSTRAREPVYYQTFTNVHLLFNTATGQCPVMGDIVLYDYGSQPGCELTLRSFWQGRVTLHGKDWQAGIVQNDFRQSADSFENGHLLLRSWEKRDQAFDTFDGSLDVVPFSRKLFLDGYAYQLDVIVRPQNGEAKPALQFTEQSVALGELKIAGQFIKRLVLPGGSYLVVLDQPADTVKIPIGSYGPPNVRLEQGGAEAVSSSSQTPSGQRVSVGVQTPAILVAGGPLTNSVTATRNGRNLQLDYQLIGTGGASYQMANRDSSRPPAFAIYKGDKQIASGNFEFG
jgi:hypothetical protein